MSGEISSLAKQLAGLVVLAGCLYLAWPEKRKITVLPAVTEPGNTEETSRPEVVPSLSSLFSPRRIEAIKRKELKRYQQKQDIKWQNWLRSVSR